MAMLAVAMVVAATATRRVPSLRVPEFIATVKSTAHTMASSGGCSPDRSAPLSLSLFFPEIQRKIATRSAAVEKVDLINRRTSLVSFISAN